MPKAIEYIPGDNRSTEMPVHRLVTSQLSQVRAVMEDQISSHASSEDLLPIISHVFRGEGKMLRPTLVLLAGMACGELKEEHIRTAAVMEMIHIATLLHDDVIDVSEQRRGCPTVNSRWGNEVAVLLGDYVLTVVFRMCTEMSQDCSRIIADTTGIVCQGEMRQTMSRGNWALSISDYLGIIRDKSAHFFSGCCQVGAVLAQGTPTQIQALADYGLQLGLAFQITDDLLDICGDATQTGKTAGRDVDNRKATLPLIHWLNQLDEDARQTALDDMDFADGNWDKLEETLTASGSLDYAREKTAGFTQAAIASLHDLKESQAHQGLEELALFLRQRLA
jgi:octaprenyl-diphosphate synthase